MLFSSFIFLQSLAQSVLCRLGGIIQTVKKTDLIYFSNSKKTCCFMRSSLLRQLRTATSCAEVFVVGNRSVLFLLCWCEFLRHRLPFFFLSSL